MIERLGKKGEKKLMVLRTKKKDDNIFNVKRYL